MKPKASQKKYMSKEGGFSGGGISARGSGTAVASRGFSGAERGGSMNIPRSASGVRTEGRSVPAKTMSLKGFVPYRIGGISSDRMGSRNEARQAAPLFTAKSEQRSPTERKGVSSQGKTYTGAIRLTIPRAPSKEASKFSAAKEQAPFTIDVKHTITNGKTRYEANMPQKTIREPQLQKYISIVKDRQVPQAERIAALVNAHRSFQNRQERSGLVKGKPAEVKPVISKPVEARKQTAVKEFLKNSQPLKVEAPQLDKRVSPAVLKEFNFKPSKLTSETPPIVRVTSPERAKIDVKAEQAKQHIRQELQQIKAVRPQEAQKTLLSQAIQERPRQEVQPALQKLQTLIQQREKLQAITKPVEINRSPKSDKLPEEQKKQQIQTVEQRFKKNLAEKPAQTRTEQKKESGTTRKGLLDKLIKEQQDLQKYLDQLMKKKPTTSVASSVQTAAVPEKKAVEVAKEKQQQAEEEQKVKVQKVRQERFKQKVKYNFFTHPELRADMDQATKALEAFIALGISQPEAERKVIQTLHTTWQKRGMLSHMREYLLLDEVELELQEEEQVKLAEEAQLEPDTQLQLQTKQEQATKKRTKVMVGDESEEEEELSGENPVVVDQKINKNRLTLEALPAIEKTWEKLEKDETYDIPTKGVYGYQLADQMSYRQYDEIKSRLLRQIITDFRLIDDGSYEEVVKRIARAGVVYTKEDAEELFEKAISETPAVYIAPDGREVEEKDIDLVLKKRDTKLPTKMGLQI